MHTCIRAYVHTHSDGANAVATTVQTAPNAIILDVMLPNRSGFEILEPFAARRPSSRPSLQARPPFREPGG